MSIPSKLVLAASLCLFLGGCAAEPPLPPGLAPVAPAPTNLPPTKTVELVIYRPQRLLGFGISPTVQMNGKDLIDMSNGYVFRTRLAPGRYVFNVDERQSGAQIEAKAGESYYLRVTIEQGVFSGGGALLLVAPQQGSYESSSLKRLPADDIIEPAFR